MGYAEVLPIEIRADDKSSPAWRSFKAGALDAKSGVEQLKSAVAGLSDGGGMGGVSDLGKLASLARNPYVALAMAVAGVGIAAVSMHQKAMALGEIASKVDMSAAAVDGLGESIRRAGGDADQAGPALVRLQETISKSSRDGGFLDDLFKLNGSTLTDATGKVRSVRDVYGELAGFIKNARSEQDRLEIATAAYGSDAAPSMVKAIMSGVDSLEKFKRNAELDDAVRQSQELERIWKSISGIGDGAGGTIGNLASSIMSRIKSDAIRFANDIGIKGAAESAYLMDNPNARRTLDNQNDIDRFYNAVGFGATKTPSNRKAPADSFAKNEFDRAVNSIGKHVAIMEADARAVGATAGEHERLRVEAQLLDAAQRAGIEVTGKQKEQFDRLALSAKNAADSLAVAKLQNDLMFERDQFGRSPTDQVVFGKLRGSGIDPNSEQGQMLAGQIRINEAMKTTQELGSEALKGFVADLRAGKNAGDAFASVLDRISAKLLDKALDSVLSGAMNGLGSSIWGAAAGQPGASAATNFAGGVIPMHTGGIVGSEAGGARRYIHAAHFNDAPRFHTGGIVGGERPIIAQDGEGVFTRGQMAALGRRSGGGFNVTIINNAGASVVVGEARPDGAGGFDLEVMIDKVTAKNVGRPGSASDRALASRGALVKR